MAYIHTVPECEAEGEIARWYRRVGNPDGTVDNVMKIHSLNLETLKSHFEMYVAAMHRPSPLSRAEREMVAVAVSRANSCRYCLHHHYQGLIHLLPAERHAAAEALREGDQSGLSEREQAMIAWAEKLTRHPDEMAEADVARLREIGLDDRAILDLGQCVGYFNYVNRIVNGLGVKLGDGEGPPGQWPE